MNGTGNRGEYYFPFPETYRKQLVEDDNLKKEELLQAIKEIVREEVREELFEEIRKEVQESFYNFIKAALQNRRTETAPTTT